MKNFMKYMIAIIVLGVTLGGVSAYKKLSAPTVFTQPEVRVETEKVIVNPLDEQIKQRNRELEDLYRKAQNLEASIDVREAEIERLEQENLKDRKELASFIAAIESRE